MKKLFLPVFIVVASVLFIGSTSFARIAPVSMIDPKATFISSQVASTVGIKRVFQINFSFTAGSNDVYLDLFNCGLSQATHNPGEGMRFTITGGGTAVVHGSNSYTGNTYCTPLYGSSVAGDKQSGAYVAAGTTRNFSAQIGVDNFTSNTKVTITSLNYGPSGIDAGPSSNSSYLPVNFIAQAASGGDYDRISGNFSIGEKITSFVSNLSNLITQVGSSTTRTSATSDLLSQFGLDTINSFERFFDTTTDSIFGTSEKTIISSFSNTLRTAVGNLPTDIKSLSIFDADGNSKRFNVDTGVFETPPASSFGSGTGQTLPSTNPKGVTNPVVNMYVICDGNASDPDGGYWWCNQNIAGNNCDEWILWHYHNGPGRCRIGAGAL